MSVWYYAWVYALNAAIDWRKRRCMLRSMWLEHFSNVCVFSLRPRILYIWVSVKQSEWYVLKNIPSLDAWIPIKSWKLYKFNLLLYSSRKNTLQTTMHYLCFPVVLEACTVVTFVHGVADHELSRVSQLSWSFYSTASTTGFTFLFLVILLHTTLYC